MADIQSLEEKIRELKEQNCDLVKNTQLWRMKYNKSEDERLSLLKENNELIHKNIQNTQKIKSYCQLLHEFACRSMKDILQASSHIENIGNILNEYEGNFESSVREPMPTSCTPGNSPSNIHLVRPMIGGVTLKTPILKVSRANLGIINNGAGIKHNISVNSSPVNNATPCVEVQSLSVCLERIDTVNQNRVASTRSVRNSTPLGEKENTTSNTDRRRHEYVLNELSVSLNRIEEINRTSSTLHRKSDFICDNENAGVGLTNNENQESREVPKQESLSPSNEHSYTNDEEMFMDYTANESMNYRDRLDYMEIIEEATGEGLSSINSIEKGCETPTKQRKSAVSDSNCDDPLEGPSWLFNESRENSFASTKSGLNFVTDRKQKKKFVEEESLFDSTSILKDVDQVPDSTTDVRDGSGIENIDAVISPPEWQSTPIIPNVEVIKNDDSAKENVPTNKIDKRDKMNNAKVILSRIRKTPQKRKSITKRGKKLLNKTCVNLFSSNNSKKSSPIHPSPNSENSITLSDESNCTMQNSDSSIQSGYTRPKRHATKKDYKEKSCTKKLRR